jgi:hypothetical protein
MGWTSRPLSARPVRRHSICIDAIVIIHMQTNLNSKPPLRVELRRSTDLPTNKFLQPFSTSVSNLVQLVTLMETLIQFSRRWNSIDLCLPYDLLESFDILTKDDVPCLEVIKINMCNWDNVPWHFPILGAACRLH